MTRFIYDGNQCIADCNGSSGALINRYVNLGIDEPSIQVTGHLKEMLEPVLQDKQLRGVAIAALLNSPTPEDRACPEIVLDGTGVVPADILTAYLDSDNHETVRKFLLLVRDRPIPPKFEIQLMFRSSSLLASDQLLDQLKDTIRRTKNRQIVPYLGLSLARRTDPDSVSLRVPIGR